MALETVKKEIIRKIKDTDEQWILKSIQKLLDIPVDEGILAYYKGKPITKESFIKELESSNDAKASNFTSDEDLEKEMGINEVPIVEDILKSERSLIEKSKWPFITVHLINGAIFFNRKLTLDLQITTKMRVQFSASEGDKNRVFFYFDNDNAHALKIMPSGKSGQLRANSKVVVNMICDAFFPHLTEGNGEETQRLMVNIERDGWIKVRQPGTNTLKQVIAYQLYYLKTHQKKTRKPKA